MFEITMFVNDEQLKKMRQALADARSPGILPVVNSDLLMVLQDALDNAEEIHATHISEERARDITLALARNAIPKDRRKTG